MKFDHWWMKSCVALFSVVIVILLAVCFVLTAYLSVVLTKKKEILQKHLSESTAHGKIDHTWLDIHGFLVYKHPV